MSAKRTTSVDGGVRQHNFNPNSSLLDSNTNGTDQLNTYTDASVTAIDAIVYMRTTNADGLSTSRSSTTKVTRIKKPSIPEQELKAATLGAELAGFCDS